MEYLLWPPTIFSVVSIFFLLRKIAELESKIKGFETDVVENIEKFRGDYYKKTGKFVKDVENLTSDETLNGYFNRMMENDSNPLLAKTLERIVSAINNQQLKAGQ